MRATENRWIDQVEEEEIHPLTPRTKPPSALQMMQEEEMMQAMAPEEDPSTTVEKASIIAAPTSSTEGEAIAPEEDPSTTVEKASIIAAPTSSSTFFPTPPATPVSRAGSSLSRAGSSLSVARGTSDEPIDLAGPPSYPALDEVLEIQARLGSKIKELRQILHDVHESKETLLAQLRTLDNDKDEAENALLDAIKELEASNTLLLRIDIRYELKHCSTSVVDKSNRIKAADKSNRIKAADKSKRIRAESKSKRIRAESKSNNNPASDSENSDSENLDSENSDSENSDSENSYSANARKKRKHEERSVKAVYCRDEGDEGESIFGTIREAQKWLETRTNTTVTYHAVYSCCVRNEKNKNSRVKGVKLFFLKANK